MIAFSVNGVPAPKGSRTAGLRRDGTAFTRPAARGEHAWTETVARSALAARAAHGGELPAAPYVVGLAFACPRPARPAHGWPTRGDLDKLVRSTLDGLVRGGLLADDRHVTELTSSKCWAHAPGLDGVDVTIRSARNAGRGSGRANAPGAAA